MRPGSAALRHSPDVLAPAHCRYSPICSRQECELTAELAKPAYYFGARRFPKTHLAVTLYEPLVAPNEIRRLLQIARKQYERQRKRTLRIWAIRGVHGRILSHM
jgi:hypothetical protein